jgi:O-acetyl-ADP-ribose deacetylase (regulator of RNase III)
MKEIKYFVGDVREPVGNGRKLVIHVCNDCGKMGSGVARALYEKWSMVRAEYYGWYKHLNHSFKLGNIQGVRVEDNIAVINMIAQKDIKTVDGVPPIRYEALRKCIQKVAELAIKYKASVHCPFLLGCDLAGGKWEIVEKIIIEELCNKDVYVTVYDINNIRGE